MNGQGVSRTNSTPAGRGDSEVTATVRHPEILICLSSGDQNALLATKCFQTFCFMHVTHMNPIKFYNFCIKIHDFLRINKEIFYVLSHISSQLNTNIIQLHGLLYSIFWTGNAFGHKESQKVQFYDIQFQHSKGSRLFSPENCIKILERS